jgi:hypothetical protein
MCVLKDIPELLIFKDETKVVPNLGDVDIYE